MLMQLFPNRIRIHVIIHTNRIRITTFGEARSRSASKENSSASIAEWTVDYIGVTSDPTKARHTSEDFSRFVVEHTLYDDVAWQIRA